MDPIRGSAGWIVLASAAAAMFLHGPIPQWPGYHDFADGRAWGGIPNAADVLSNLAFALVGLRAIRFELEARAAGRTPGEVDATRALIASLILTAAGSAYYHLAPDNARLAFDRVPIALACASVLCAFHARGRRTGGRIALPVMLALGAASVGWWSFSEARGTGDLRPYLLLQAAPLVLVPIWQWACDAPRTERMRYGQAIALYVLAKACEVLDHRVLEWTGFVSGHTAKHLLAALAAMIILSILQSPRRGTIE